ncbi:hypothetical protein Drorol1_Dr00004132 [Drosera rotundifolia]
MAKYRRIITAFCEIECRDMESRAPAAFGEKWLDRGRVRRNRTGGCGHRRTPSRSRARAKELHLESEPYQEPPPERRSLAAHHSLFASKTWCELAAKFSCMLKLLRRFSSSCRRQIILSGCQAASPIDLIFLRLIAATTREVITSRASFPVREQDLVRIRFPIRKHFGVVWFPVHRSVVLGCSG